MPSTNSSLGLHLSEYFKNKFGLNWFSFYQTWIFEAIKLFPLKLRFVCLLSGGYTPSHYKWCFFGIKVYLFQRVARIINYKKKSKWRERCFILERDSFFWLLLWNRVLMQTGKRFRSARFKMRLLLHVVLVLRAV